MTTTYGTHKGHPVYSKEPKSADGSAPRYIGMDKNKGEWYFVTLSSQGSFVASLDNPTSLDQPLTYTHQVGSTIGFSQKVGVSVEASAGIDLGVVNFGGKVTASGELGFTQAFNDVTTFTVKINVPAGKTITVTEATMTVQYWLLQPLFAPDLGASPPLKTLGYIWAKGDNDVIDTGAYGLEQTDLP